MSGSCAKIQASRWIEATMACAWGCLLAWVVQDGDCKGRRAMNAREYGSSAIHHSNHSRNNHNSSSSSSSSNNNNRPSPKSNRLAPPAPKSTMPAQLSTRPAPRLNQTSPDTQPDQPQHSTRPAPMLNQASPKVNQTSQYANIRQKHSHLGQTACIRLLTHQGQWKSKSVCWGQWRVALRQAVC